MTLKVTLLEESQPEEEAGPKEIPSQVQILVNAFKGTIVTGK
jgi:hypothetical protein